MVAANFPKALELVLQSEEKLTIARARQELNYDPVSGQLKWLRASNNRQRLAGDVAGFEGSKGYIRLKFLGKENLAHRLIWAMMTGGFPDREVDHINGVRSDNRWSNLRLVDPSQQRANAKINSNSSSGVRGVYFNKRRGKWRAHYQRRHLGYFETIDDASSAVARAFDEATGAEFRRAAA